MSTDDEVGYGKPPAASRWKPGQSGNPRGRPSSPGHDLLTEAASILSEPVTAKTADGKDVRLGGLEAAYFALCRKALKGNDAALFQAVRVMLEVVPAGEKKQAESDARGAAAKRKLWVMIGLDEKDYPEP
jgi:hypothetical protein